MGTNFAFKVFEVITRVTTTIMASTTSSSTATATQQHSKDNNFKFVAILTGLMTLAFLLVGTVLMAQIRFVKRQQRLKNCIDNDDKNSTLHFSTNKEDSAVRIVPFLNFDKEDPNWKHLEKAVTVFERERHTALENLSRQLQLALAMEQDMLLESRRTTSSKSSKRRRPRHSSLNNNKLLLSTHIRRKIDTLSELYQRDVEVLRRTVLTPFQAVKALPDSTPSATTTASHARMSDDDDASSDDDKYDNLRSNGNNNDTDPSFLFQYYVKGGTFKDDDTAGASVAGGGSSYGSVAQVVAHLVRDWSSDGRAIRHSIYPWIRTKLLEYSDDFRPSRDGSTTTTQSVLVPGAGLGRLAWELATTTASKESSLSDSNGAIGTTADCYFRVHAVERSTAFLAAANFCFSTNQSVVLHPYASDYFTNEVDSQQRYEQVRIPDVLPSTTARNATIGRGHLSYSMGDFVQIATTTIDPGTYDAVVTCFFLDTATNIFEYLHAIHQVLRVGGLFVNVGPLQWHYNALLQLSVGELRDLLLAFGFEILEWSVDLEPLEYRNEMQYHRRRGQDEKKQESGGGGVGSKSEPRSTHYDAYCPLRFVARKK